MVCPKVVKKLKCQQYNIIPYRKNKNNYAEWRLYYDKYLMNLFSIFVSTFNSHYDHDLDFNYNLFCRYIYISSSKHIPRY
jgi:hypothetical protein